MSFKFPTSGTTLSVPDVGSTFGVGSKVWTWDGSVFFRSDLGQVGATGATGTGITNVNIGDDGKLSFNFDNEAGTTIDLGDVIKPAGFKYVVGVNPGVTGTVLIGAQGATSNFLTFNPVDLDENDTTKFFDSIIGSPKNTTLTIRSLKGATQISTGLETGSITVDDFRIFQGISGSGFTSPFTIGDFVFLFKETSGKTGAGVTNPTLTDDGRLVFETIDADGNTGSVNVGEVRGATGSTGQDGIDGASASGVLEYNVADTFRYEIRPAFGNPSAGFVNILSDLAGGVELTFNTTDKDGKDATEFFNNFPAIPDPTLASAARTSIDFQMFTDTEAFKGTASHIREFTSSSVFKFGITQGFNSGNKSILTSGRTFFTTRFTNTGITNRTIAVGITGATFVVSPDRNNIRNTNVSSVLNKIQLNDEMVLTATDGSTLTDGDIKGITNGSEINPVFALSNFSGGTFSSGATIVLTTIGTQGAAGVDGVDGATGASGAGFTAPVLNDDGTLSLTTITNLGAESVVNIGTVRGASGATGVTGTNVVGFTFSTTATTAESQTSSGVTANDVTLTFGFTFGLETPQPSGSPILTTFRPATSAATFRVLNGASGQASTNTDPSTNPGINIGGTPTLKAEIANATNTIAFGDLSAQGNNALKGTTQSNGTILAIRDFQNTGGAGASGSDVLIQAKQGLKLGRVDLGGSNFSDMQIRLFNGSTTDTGTVLDITPNEFRFAAGSSTGLFGVHKDQAFGVSVKTVPLFTHAQHQALTGVSMGAGISFSNSTHQASAAADVASFTITSSSAISTGAKTNALYRIPYLCEFTNFDIRANKTGGITLSLRLSSDPGSPTTGESTSTTLHASGLTASTETFQTGGSIAGKFLHINVTGNDAGATNAQAFVSFKPAESVPGD